MGNRLASAWGPAPFVQCVFLVAMGSGCENATSPSEPDGAAPDVNVPTDGSSVADDVETGAADTPVVSDAGSEADIGECACSPTGTGFGSRGSMSLPCFCAVPGTRCYSYEAAPAGCVANGGTGKIDFYESCRRVVK